MVRSDFEKSYVKRCLEIEESKIDLVPLQYRVPACDFIPQKEDFIELMQRIFPRGGNGQRQKIEKILKNLAETDVCLVDEIKSDSSLLLHEIENARDNEYGDYLKDFELSPKEFFVYLYHELLLEDLLKD